MRSLCPNILSNPTVASSPSLSHKLFRALIGAAAFFCVCGRADEPQNLTDPRRFDQPITVGTAVDSYPYSYLGSDKQCEGFAVDLLEAVARVMSIRVKRVNASASELAELFQKGNLDMLQAFSPGPGRETYADFSAHYMRLQGGYFVRKNETRYHSPAELNNAEVAIPGNNSIGEKYLRDNSITARLVHTRSVEESLKELNSGKHDAAFAARLSALAYIERNHLANICALGQPLVGYDIRNCFAVRKGDAILLARLNEGLAIINRSGEYDNIYHKWFGRFDNRLVSREQVVFYVAAALALALTLTTLGLFRQRTLRNRLTKQSRRIAESEAILAEAQRIARLGNWHYDLISHKVECSSEAMRILGRNPGHAPPSYFRLLATMPRPERSLVHRSIQGALHDGIACEVTVPLQTSPGVTKILHLTARPLKATNGNVSGLFGTVQDITRQKAAEEGLRAREQLLRALYENVPSAMGVVEEAGSSFRFVSANPGTARLLGLHSTSLANRVLSELPLPTAVVDFWTHWFQEGSRRQDILKIEHHHEVARRHYAITLVPLGGGETNHRRQLCFLIDDITERKEIDTEIAQGRRLRAIGELVGGIAHEFNNLLTPIMLKIELLSLEFARNPRLLEELETVSRATKRGADLTRRLLTFGRRGDTNLEEVGLLNITKANFDLLRPTIDRRITLVLNLTDNLPVLFVNPSDLHQIVLNLLLNARDTLMEKLARDATNSWEARITVDGIEPGASELATSSGSRPPMRWLRLTVRDNGMGMTPEVRERIFEPFYTTKEVGKGTGLGLATVWHLVTRLGGKITVESEPGKGSAFHVWLPVTGPKPVGPITKPQVDLHPTAISANILLVEDDELVAKTVITALRRMGHTVTHQVNGNDAWQHLSSHPAYDLLLLDLDLPGISGIEITRRARGIHYTGHILIASGRLSEAEIHELDTLRIDGKLQKPFTPQALAAAIQTSLSR
jgi:signal transduction histidine kinase/ABC-type amino acid transport substrate-binding protein/CheY-like chemotaxis protein